MKKQAWAVLTLSALLTVSTFSVAGAVKPAPDASGKDEKIVVTTDKDSNKVYDDLEAILAEKADGDTVPVIIRLTEKFSDDKLAKLKKDHGDFKTKFTFQYAYQGFAGELTKKQIERLQKLPMIESIQFDAPVKADMATAVDSFGSKKAVTDFGVDGDRDGNPTSYSKNDVVVAIIDTGIHGGHVDLDGGKILAFKDFVSNQTAPYDDNGHGTHVGGIVAGTGEGDGLNKGVAPGAALVGIKVLDGQGSGTMSNVDAGINWAIQNKDVYGIKVMNLSLGTSGSSDGTDSTSTAINNAYAAGIVPAVAAGNSGPKRSTIGSPGAARDALTVGAFADVGEMGFNVTSFSSRGPTADGRIKPDIMAPGFNITAPKTGTTNGYVTYSGTSMATPYTAGVAALMLDANYALSPAQIRSIMFNTAEDWGPAGQDIDYGYGRLRAYDAVKSAGGYAGTGPSVPTHTGVVDSLTTSGQKKSFTFNVTATGTPAAVTLIMRDHTSSWFSSSPDFDLFVYNPSGTLVNKSEGTTRQELVTFNPTVTGTYRVDVLSYSGTGTFLLDMSAK
ncbi:S8 family serine peptidase [Tumebacillus sp. DT12]|uniref:S8 family serine peptidase n=1 Tax=Tumebacillus lacus TaxID=2995335 RepID=A0ABT3WUI6_9BACL|nr:S8 family serine peptidase [Tumebacillus lacus]MCX7568370.1 S8 family serine peptidase [Tumebacillus lacus]